MAELDTIQEVDRPATVESIAADLTSLGLVGGALVLVHSSLSSLGWVSGGATAVIEALRQAVGESGTLVMPAHSAHLSDPAHWKNPPVPEAWWPVIRETMPAFDARTTPTRGMGAIPELFRTLPGVVRGDHPLFSFAASGPLAEEIVNPHSLTAGLGPGSPLERIGERGGSVLLLGVDHDNNTSLHLAEHRALAKHAGTIVNGAPMLVDGERRWVAIDEIDVPETDFQELGRSLESATGVVRRGKVARAEARLMSQSELVDYAEGWFRECV